MDEDELEPVEAFEWALVDGQVRLRLYDRVMDYDEYWFNQNNAGQILDGLLLLLTE